MEEPNRDAPQMDEDVAACGAYDCAKPGVARVAFPGGEYDYDQYGFEVRLGETVKVLVCADHQQDIRDAYAAYRERQRERAVKVAAADEKIAAAQAMLEQAQRERDRL